MNKDTYTAMLLDGAIVVVENVPEEPHVMDVEDDGTVWGLYDAVSNNREQKRYNEQLAACTKYPTLDQDKDYWQSKIGQQVGIVLEEQTEYDGSAGYEVTYAIPPQNDVDLWDEAEQDLKRMNKGRIRPMGWKAIREYLKSNYNLTKK